MSSTLLIFGALLCFVLGLLLGFGLSSQQQQQPQQATPALSCPTLTAPAAAADEQRERRQRQRQRQDDDEDARLPSCPAEKVSSSSSSCDAYFSDVKTSFLSSFDAAKAPPTSILLGGTAKITPEQQRFVANVKSFRAIGDAAQDDKTLLHRFDLGYSAYLEPVRHLSSKLSIFEIGLGCNQERAVGSSARLWREYLPGARIAMLEFDEKCARDWPRANANLISDIRIYPGDQAKATTWQRVLAAEGADRAYDLIVDDGGHTMQQHLVTFMHLWPRLKPGGVYVIEDLNTAWKTRYGGDKRQTAASHTTNNVVKSLMDRVHALPVPGHKRKWDEDVASKSPIFRVDCQHFICFISKRW